MYDDEEAIENTKSIIWIGVPPTASQLINLKDTHNEAVDRWVYEGGEMKLCMELAQGQSTYMMFDIIK